MNHRCAIVVLALCTSSLFAADPFLEGVRSTPARTPKESQKAFKLPPGFEIQLVAAEPQIKKPMNLAFDAKGRLWVTDSEEYPIAAPKSRKGKDTIKVLEDTDGDGRADKITTFAEGLNIPIGLYPYKNGVIAFSIPNITFYQDTDGDGKSDKEEILYGPLGWERDTHGMNNAFRRGFDGWLYISHGFNNTSTVRGKDGSQITMISGNTYRVRLDGSRVEQYTYGQVNPFGLCFDELGNLYSSDCHSLPIYQLLRGGEYPGFGKMPEGIGFGPVMIQHLHGSTAIGGVSTYADDQFPAEYRNNFFVGNVMTSKVNRDTVENKGSTRVGKEAPDFVTTDDSWFRPVDTQLGPDGSMYIADFYNRIIGHYEVDINHPGRDRTSGRIWKVVYKGTDAKPRTRKDLTKATPQELITALSDANLTYRMLAMNQLVDRVGEAAVKPLEKALRNKKANPYQQAHGLWVLFRLGKLGEKEIAQATVHSSALVRTHAQKMLAETGTWTPALRKAAIAGLKDKDAWVQRAAAEALSLHPSAEQLQPLITARQRAPETDTHLVYMLRLSIREQLAQPKGFTQVASLTEADQKVVSDVAIAVKTPAAGSYLLQTLQNSSDSKDLLTRTLKHVARYAPVSDMGRLSKITQEKFSTNPDLQFELFKSAQQGLEQRGEKLPEAFKEWGSTLAVKLLDASTDTSNSWGNTPLETSANAANPWVLEKRNASDGKDGMFFTSLLGPGAETGTGALRSGNFKAPSELQFFLAGHRGFPEKPAHEKNVVRLRDATTDEILVTAFPPRNDVAQPVKWDLATHKGRNVYVEIVDGDTTPTGFAWLAAGRFEPPVVSLPSSSPQQISARQQAAADLTGVLQLTSVEPRLADLLNARSTDADARAAIAKTLVTMKPREYAATVTPILGDNSLPVPVRQKIAEALVESNNAIARQVVLDALHAAPLSLATKLAQSLAGNPAGAEALLKSVETGKVTARILQERAVKDRFTASKPRNAVARIQKLTANLTPLNAELEKLIIAKKSAYNPAKAQVAEGARVFTQNCAVCHQVDGQGGLVGPQLDGIANRGLDRILEDVIDPNRNVDHAFRSSLVTLKDGEVVSGLFRREEGEILIFADSAGKELSIPKKDVQARKESESSLMPEGLVETISPDDFDHLVAYLLSKGAKPTAAAAAK